MKNRSFIVSAHSCIFFSFFSLLAVPAVSSIQNAINMTETVIAVETILPRLRSPFCIKFGNS